MVRPVTSSVSALSGIVANGHQAMHLVSSAPSKIPYGGFSPVRLQTRLTPRPPSPGCLSGLWAVTVGISFPGVLSVVGLSSNRHRELLTSTAGPVALGSPFGYSVRTVHRLLWPHPRLWASVPASWLFPTRPRTPEVPQFTPRVFSDRVVSRTPAVFVAARDCFFAMNAGFAVFAPARQPHRQTLRSGLLSVTRLQISLYGTTRSIASPAPARTFTTELAPEMSPSRGVGYDYAGFSQFLRPVFHWQDSRPYGLQAKIAKHGQLHLESHSLPRLNAKDTCSDRLKIFDHGFPG